MTECNDVFIIDDGDKDMLKLASKSGHPVITVGVLDGPVDLAHDALTASDIISLDKPRKVISNHGTFVTSLIVGVWEDRSILCKYDYIKKCSLKIITKSIYQEDDKGRLMPCTLAEIGYGIRELVDAGVDLINISGGARYNELNTPQVLDEAIKLCEEKNVLVIAATGNRGINTIDWPARYGTVIAVGSMNDDQQLPLSART